MDSPKIIVLMPTRGIILTEVQDALDQELATNMQSPVILHTHDLPLPVSRNFLVETALQQDWWTHALLIDDDVIMPKGSLKQMLKLKTDVAIVDYPMQNKVDGQSISTIVHDDDGSIAYAGLGIALIKREVFEKIGSPWFVLTEYRIRRSENGKIGFFAGQPDGKEMSASAGEDTYFYLQCHKHNFKIKQTKLTAAHCRLDQFVTNTHTIRYVRQHVITKNNVIQRELL